MDTDIHYNIIGARFDEFSNFLFNHEVVPVPTNGSGGPEPWYWNASVTFDPVAVSTFYSQLFDSPEFLLDKFSHSQIEQGFWAIQSCNLACSVAEIIWHKHVNFAMRADCVRSMFNLYEKLFSHFPSETASEMWWDSLAYDWHCGNKARKNGGEEEQMQDVMFETSLSDFLCEPGS